MSRPIATHIMGPLSVEQLRATLDTLAGSPGAKAQEAVPAEKLEEMRKRFEEEFSKLFSEPCAGHGKAHEALSALLREVYTIHVLPERAQEPFLRLITEHVFHRANPNEMFELLEGDRFAPILYVCLGLAYLYENEAVQKAARDSKTPGYL